MPRQPDTPTTVASTGTGEVAMFGIGSHSVGRPLALVQSASVIETIEIVYVRP
jgi:hypothetical protein